jgi:hypothetical protein
MEKTRTLVEINGPWALVVLAFPTVLALLPVVFPKRAVRILSATRLVIFSLLGAFTVGLAYLPAAVAMGFGAAARHPEIPRA